MTAIKGLTMLRPDPIPDELLCLERAVRGWRVTVKGKLLSVALVLVAGLVLPAMAFAQGETEPNDSKATANLFTLPAVNTLGVITGNSTSAAGVGLDYFRVTTAAQAAPGFYRHRLIATSTIVGHTLTIRGLNQVGGVPGTVDSAVQTSSAATVPPRFVQWYTSQAPGELFVRATGVAATTANYSLDYEVQLVTEVAGPTINEGLRTITSVGVSVPQADTDLWIYDPNRVALVGFGNDDEFGTASLGSRLTRTYVPGVHHMAITNFNYANNLGSPPDDDFVTGLVMDFPGAQANSSTTVNINLGTTIDGINVPATKTGPFDIVFVAFTVVVPVELTGFSIE